MEAIAITISVFSLLGTLALGLYSNVVTKKIAKKNLSKEFFERIFFETISVDLPNKLKRFEYEGNVKVHKSIEELKELIIEILENAYFYKYFDYAFYEKIKEVLLEIEDILVMIPDNNRPEKIKDDKEKISLLFNKLYKVLRDYYMELSFKGWGTFPQKTIIYIKT